MASIDYAEIVGTRMAEEGSAGYSVNSTSYSVLIYYSDGTVNLIEGNADRISPFLPYMRSSKSILEQLEAKLEASIEKTVYSVLYELRNPLPKGLTGTSKQEAKVILEKAGFSVEYLPTASSETDGVVLECMRKENDYTTAVLKMKYNLPDVTGLDEDIAVQKLKSAGFTPIIKKTKAEGIDENKVIKIQQENSDSLDIDVYVCQQLHEDRFIQAMGSTDSMTEIYKIWEKEGLGERYPEIDKYLKGKIEFERYYGKIKEVDKEKAKVIAFLEAAYIKE